MARPKGSKNRKTLLAEAIQAGLQDLLLEEVPKVVEAALCMAKDGDKDAMGLVFKHFIVPQTDLAKERLARETKVTARLPGGKTVEAISDSTQDAGFSITFNVVGDEPEAIEGEVVDDD